jgi:hypothetical protein
MLTTAALKQVHTVWQLLATFWVLSYLPAKRTGFTRRIGTEPLQVMPVVLSISCDAIQLHASPSCLGGHACLCDSGVFTVCGTAHSSYSG